MMRSNPPRRITSLPKMIFSCSIVTVISVPPYKIRLKSYEIGFHFGGSLFHIYKLVAFLLTKILVELTFYKVFVII